MCSRPAGPRLSGGPVGTARLRRAMALSAAAAVAAVFVAASASAAMSPLRLGDGDRLLVVAPHPNDETLAAGGLIQEAAALDLPVQVCFFTMGDNHEIPYLFTRRHPDPLPGAARSMASRRQIEAIASSTQLGLATNQLVFLGYPDTGLMTVWQRHWRDTPPYRSPLTRANTVPYDRALTPGSAHAGEDILDDLLEVLRGFQPTRIVLPHPADHNADHRAIHLFVRAALWQLESEGAASPELLAAPVHFTQWPEPRRYQPLRHAAPPFFLRDNANWMEYSLAPFQVSNKLAAIRRHHSQFRPFPAYLESFVRKTELFAAIPDLAFPGGTGDADLPEEDPSRFQPDETLFEELSRLAEPWSALAGQHAAETRTLAGHDNRVVRQTLAGDGSSLTLAFDFDKPLSEDCRLAVYLFGHRPGTPFGEMPKIEITATPQTIIAVRDLAANLPARSIELLPGSPREIALRIPLDLLGSPARLLTGAELSKDTLPVDWLPWRALDLTGSPSPVEIPPPAAGSRDDPSAPSPPQSPSAFPAPTASPPPDPAGHTESPAVSPPRLVPRVRLPKPAPKATEADEPVFW